MYKVIDGRLVKPFKIPDLSEMCEIRTKIVNQWPEKVQRNQGMPHQLRLDQISTAIYGHSHVFSVTAWVAVFTSHSPTIGERKTDKERSSSGT